MLTLPPGVRVFVATARVDGRNYAEPPVMCGDGMSHVERGGGSSTRWSALDYFT